MRDKDDIYVGGPNSASIRQRLFQELPQYVKQGMTVLDVGAGDLTTAREIASRFGARVDAIDLKLPKDPAIRTFHANLDERWPLRDAYYDVVISTAVIEHMENPYHFMREISRVLKPRGIAIVSTHNIDQYWSKLHFLLTNQHKAFVWKDCDAVGEHRTPLNEEQLCWIGGRVNLKTARIFYGNPALKIIPFVPALKRVPCWKTLGQEVFIVFEAAKEI
jgi:SAM-dependent methyltransferase